MDEYGRWMSKYEMDEEGEKIISRYEMEGEGKKNHKYSYQMEG